MDFKPFSPPPSDHHNLSTGLSTEGGVTAKGFVEGVNEAFQHLFGIIGGKKSDDADRITELEEAVTAIQKRNGELEEHMTALLGSFDKFLAAQAPKPDPVAASVQGAAGQTVA